MNDNVDDEEDGELLTDSPVVVLLPEDKDFDHDRGQSRMRSQMMDDHLGGGGGDEVSIGDGNESYEDSE